jgi:xanthine/uracil permease
MAGLILVLFGLIPKMSILVASIPQFVLGGAGIVMFGMVLSTGIKILTRVNFNTNRYNAYIVAISLGLGMIPIVAADFFTQMPSSLQPLLHSGILLSSVAAVLLNLYFNGYHPEE